jgi:hypothetical protein
VLLEMLRTAIVQGRHKDRFLFDLIDIQGWKANTLGLAG